MMKAHLDHIGIAIQPNSPLAEVFEVLGLPIASRERVERESLDIDWIPLPAGDAVSAPHLELLHPYEESSVIGKFLAKNKRDGVHHLCFRVDDALQVGVALQNAGFQLIYPLPKAGAHDCLVNFLHPQSTGGVLIEISQKVAK